MLEIQSRECQNGKCICFPTIAVMKPSVWGPMLLPVLLYNGLLLTHTAQSVVFPCPCLFSCTPLSVLIPLATAYFQIHIYSIFLLSFLTTRPHSKYPYSQYELFQRTPQLPTLFWSLYHTCTHVHGRFHLPNVMSHSVYAALYSPFVPWEGSSHSLCSRVKILMFPSSPKIFPALFSMAPFHMPHFFSQTTFSLPAQHWWCHARLYSCCPIPSEWLPAPKPTVPIIVLQG